MKKGKIMLGLTVAGAAVFAFASCAATGQDPSSTLSSTNDVLGMGAVTTVELLGTQVSSGALQTLSAVRLFAEETGTENTDASTGTENTGTGAENTGADEAEKTPAQEQAETFNKYFSMLDSLLGDDVITTEVSNNTDEGYEAYAYKLVIKGKDMKGEDVVHLMYYNETEKTVPVDSTQEQTGESGESTVQTASKHIWEVEKKKHENKTKTEYVMEGVMVVDETDYILRGERSIETEEDETENEIEIRAYLDEADTDTFVRMKQETSVEENETEKEYVYSVVKDGKLIEQTAVEFETEKKGDREDVQYELEFRNGEGRGRYCVERKTKDGESFMKVSYIINGQRGVFFIHQTEDGQYEYTFDNGNKEMHEGRDRHEMPGAPHGGMNGGMNGGMPGGMQGGMSQPGGRV